MTLAREKPSEPKLSKQSYITTLKNIQNVNCRTSFVSHVSADHHEDKPKIAQCQREWSAKTAHEDKPKTARCKRERSEENLDNLCSHIKRLRTSSFQTCPKKLTRKRAFNQSNSDEPSTKRYCSVKSLEKSFHSGFNFKSTKYDTKVKPYISPNDSTALVPYTPPGMNLPNFYLQFKLPNLANERQLVKYNTYGNWEDFTMNYKKNDDIMIDNFDTSRSSEDDSQMDAHMDNTDNTCLYSSDTMRIELVEDDCQV